jgi:hypothetical protein
MDNYEKILKAFDGGGIKFVNNEEGVGAIEINNK